MTRMGKWFGTIVFFAMTGGACIGNHPQNAFIAICFGCSFLISAVYHKD